MDERYDPAYQRGSTTEPAQQPRPRAGGRIRESAAHPHPRTHPLHETEHWQPAGTRSTAAHLDAADSAGPHELIGSDGGSDTDASPGAEGIEVFRPLGIVENDVPAVIPRSAGAASSGAGALASASPSAGTGGADGNSGTVGNTSNPGASHSGGLDAFGADDLGTSHFDDGQTTRTRNPWEGALWVIGIGLVLFGAFATWQSIQRTMYGWSDQNGPPADYLTNTYLGQLAPIAITIGLATIVGLLFRRLFAHDRRSRP